MATPVSGASGAPSASYADQSTVDSSAEKKSIPGYFSTEEGKVVFNLTEKKSDKPKESLADMMRASTNYALYGSNHLAGQMVSIITADYDLLSDDLRFVETVTQNGAPLYQELENLEAILLSAPTSGDMTALVNFNGGEHATNALNYVLEFISFSQESGVSNENLNAGLYDRAETAVNKMLKGEAPSKEDAAALRAVVSAAKVPMEPYSHANVASLLQSTSHDMEKIKNDLSRLSG